MDYVLRILEASRANDLFQGLSPRAGKDIIKAAKSWALLEGRDYVLPDDVQIILPFVVSHRLAPFQSQSFSQDLDLTKTLLSKVTID